MKKLHLYKLFHWLYALLMLLPFILFLGYIISSWGTPIVYPEGYEGMDEFFESLVHGLINNFSFFPLDNVFNWLDSFFGTDPNIVRYLLIYWIVTSVYWLVFDVIIYIINVAHHWLDVGGDKL